MEKEIFEVGLTLSFEAYYKTHLATQVVGWEKNAFLLTKGIYVQGQPAKLKNNDPCKIRFLKDGVAYGFESAVISVQFFPFSLMFIKYPEKLETVKIRVAPRFKVDLPTKLMDNAKTLMADALILDISEGGCGLRVPVEEGKELSPEGTYAITFSVMDKEISLGCGVRKLDKGTETWFLGVEFTNITPQNKEALTLFLDFLKKHPGG